MLRLMKVQTNNHKEIWIQVLQNYLMDLLCFILFTLQRQSDLWSMSSQHKIIFTSAKGVMSLLLFICPSDCSIKQNLIWIKFSEEVKNGAKINGSHFRDDQNQHLDS